MTRLKTLQLTGATKTVALPRKKTAWTLDSHVTSSCVFSGKFVAIELNAETRIISFSCGMKQETIFGFLLVSVSVLVKMKMSWICVKMDFWVNHIFTSMVFLHYASFWYRGEMELINGLLTTLVIKRHLQQSFVASSLPSPQSLSPSQTHISWTHTVLLQVKVWAGQYWPSG